MIQITIVTSFAVIALLLEQYSREVRVTVRPIRWTNAPKQN